jgi:hypothetical protein
MYDVYTEIRYWFSTEHVVRIIVQREYTEPTDKTEVS